MYRTFQIIHFLEKKINTFCHKTNLFSRKFIRMIKKSLLIGLFDVTIRNHNFFLDVEWKLFIFQNDLVFVNFCHMTFAKATLNNSFVLREYLRIYFSFPSIVIWGINVGRTRGSKFDLLLSIVSHLFLYNRSFIQRNIVFLNTTWNFLCFL